MILLFILAIVVISSIVRLITLPFRYGLRNRGPFLGYGNEYNNPYGYGRGCYGYRRHHGLGHFIVVILVLVFLSHVFGHHHHYDGGF